MDNDDTQTPKEDRPEEGPSSLGDMLKVAREDKGLSLEQLAADLRVELRFLDALERENFEILPPLVFTKGYLRQYAQRVGLDYADLLAEYYRHSEVRDAPMMAAKPIRLRDEQQISRWTVAGLVLIAFVVGFGVWYLSSDTPPPAEVTEPSEEPLDPGMNEETAMERPAPAAALIEEPTPTPEPLLEPEQGLESDIVLETESNEILAVYTEPGSAFESMALNTEPVPDLPPGPTVEVTITFEQDCWTEVTDVRGERAFYGLGSAGVVSSFDGQLPLSFFLGNAGGVRLQLNGRPYSIPDDSRQGNLARFVIAEGF